MEWLNGELAEQHASVRVDRRLHHHVTLIAIVERLRRRGSAPLEAWGALALVAAAVIGARSRRRRR